jgi:hypothetical protein
VNPLATDSALPGIEVLTPTSAKFIPGEPFRPTDPLEAAEAQGIPSGLRFGVAEDIDDLEEIRPFSPVTIDEPITAVDVGVVKLGNTADGIVGAVRGAAVTHFPDGNVHLRTYRPGIFAFNAANRLASFHDMGRYLGRPDFYVSLSEDGEPIGEKVRLGPHDHRLIDRARNFVERLIQRQVLETMSTGTLALDGALTMRTWDTPGVFIRRLHELAQDRGVSLVAVAKKTGLALQGVDIRLLLDGETPLPGRRKLTPALRRENGGTGEQRLLGDLYVARFAPGGETYRVDVDAAPGWTSAAALDAFASRCLFRSGYPEPLLQAHLFSFMPPPVVVTLQAWAAAKLGLVLLPEARMTPVFAPFGGKYR